MPISNKKARIAFDATLRIDKSVNALLSTLDSKKADSHKVKTSTKLELAMTSNTCSKDTCDLPTENSIASSSSLTGCNKPVIHITAKAHANQETARSIKRAPCDSGNTEVKTRAMSRITAKAKSTGTASLSKATLWNFTKIVLQANVKTKAITGNSSPSTTRRPNKMESRVPPRPSAQAHNQAKASDAAKTINSIGIDEFCKSKKISCNAFMVLQIC